MSLRNTNFLHKLVARCKEGREKSAFDTPPIFSFYSESPVYTVLALELLEVCDCAGGWGGLFMYGLVGFVAALAADGFSAAKGRGGGGCEEVGF